MPKGRIPETTLKCIQYLRQTQPDSKISVEVEKPNREGLDELAQEADVVFYSRSWAEVSCSVACRSCGWSREVAFFATWTITSLSRVGGMRRQRRASEESRLGERKCFFLRLGSHALPPLPPSPVLYRLSCPAAF